MNRHVPSEITSIILGKLPVNERYKQALFSKAEFQKIPKHVRMLLMFKSAFKSNVSNIDQVFRSNVSDIDQILINLFDGLLTDNVWSVSFEMKTMARDIRDKNPFSDHLYKLNRSAILVITKLDWKEAFVRFIHNNYNPLLTNITLSHKLSQIYLDHMCDNCYNEYYPIYHPNLSRYPDLAERFVDYFCRDDCKYIKNLEYKNRVEYLNKFLSLIQLWDKGIMTPSFENWQLSGFMDMLVGSCSHPRILELVYNDADQKIAIAVWKNFRETYRKLREEVTIQMILKSFAPKYRDVILNLEQEI